MHIHEFLEYLRTQRFFRDQIAHIQCLPPKSPEYADLPGGICNPLEPALHEHGIHQFYSHQALAIQKIREGRHIVVVTGTASGKTLCYAVPEIEAVLADDTATMLHIYPTKALAQDQLRTLRNVIPTDTAVCSTYDGDTAQHHRRKLRESSNIILTNPDMLHQGILPQHARWSRFFANLKYIVIDEVHAYRGVFGSHLANVIRRTHRICRHYGSNPQFICSSATIANPREHAGSICGVEMDLVHNDGSPQGAKQFIFWNPPSLETEKREETSLISAGGDRRSALYEAVELMTLLIRTGISVITFTRTRLAAELVYRHCRDRLKAISPGLEETIHAYRGGYLPEERRDIERRLADGDIRGVSTTNALELGIDIGTLDACIMVGYPGTITGMWQQAGRAGRGAGESIVFMIAQNAPIDQYLMAHGEYVFSRTPEHGVIDPDNPHIVVGHLKCAASELPVSDTDADQYGEYGAAVMDLLADERAVKRIADQWYWSTSEFPAAEISLRNISGTVYTIQDGASAERVIGTMDEVSAFSQLHDNAVYLHGADTYLVKRLDIEKKIAFVERKELDYYTHAVRVSEIRIDEWEEKSGIRGGLLGFGDVTVTTMIPMFRKVRFHSRQNLGMEALELPPQVLETVALWFKPPESVIQQIKSQGYLPVEAFVGIANVLAEVAPLFVMCDVQDIGTVVDTRNLDRETLFLHDRYPGGMGFSRRCYDRFEEMLQTVNDIIVNCGCSNGCPSCVGSVVQPVGSAGMDAATQGGIPSKAAALSLLDLLLTAPDTVPGHEFQTGM